METDGGDAIWWRCGMSEIIIGTDAIARMIHLVGRAAAQEFIARMDEPEYMERLAKLANTDYDDLHDDERDALATMVRGRLLPAIKSANKRTVLDERE
jgi:hypothetical protein